jgi:hypothetical protein
VVNLSELSPVANTLNQKSNQINAVISKINAKLLTLNLGIEVWIEMNDTGLNLGSDENDQAVKYRSRDLLGYTQCGKDWKWQLAVRHEQTTYVYNQEREEETVCAPYITPLLSASRALRIEAMQNMDALLTMLKQHADHIIKTINEAEAAADRL